VAATGAYSFTTAILTELFGTAVLMWGILASGDSKNTGLTNNLGPLLVGGTVLAVGLSLGGPSGYAINPARDFGPRLFGTLVSTQGLWDGGYWLIPLIVPVIGGVIGIYMYDWLVSANLAKK
jgi:glycerol uptake facilitator protein